MQREKLWLFLLYGLAAVAITLPIVAAIRLADYQSLLNEQRHAAAIAANIVRNSDRITDQVGMALADLRATHAIDPCSDSSIAHMRALVIRSNRLIDVGYVRGNELTCSSFGRQVVAIGPPSYVSAYGYLLRVGVRHPLAPDAGLLIVVDPKSGYAALVSQSLPIDFIPEESNLIVALVNVSQGTVLAQRGGFHPDWLRRIDSSSSGTFDDGMNLVVWHRSAVRDYAAIAAIGQGRIEEGQRHIVLLLLPIGLAAAVLLTVVVVRVARFRLSTRSLLKNAIRKRELFLVYQPIVNLQSGEWTGVEALLRWRRPNGEQIPPDVFIPVAEQTQLMPKLTDAVFRNIERDAAKLLRARPDFYIALNLSAEDICRPDVVDRLRGLIQRMGVEARNLRVEATERVFMNVEASRRNIRLLRALGIRVAIDDFGTGYSSLSYLQNLELDCLKIDKTFVDSIGTEAVTSEVVRHIIGMAKSLNMHMIAEGVETTVQAEFLREQGVQCCQGWLFSKPLTMAQLLTQMGIDGVESHGEVRVPTIKVAALHGGT
ncbi:MAG TPA: EAL domain-containing protein [Steroidobacteraceae bacterium]|nr:EAL domain-containing protein [Steroidobacteraceae bacterium]